MEERLFFHLLELSPLIIGLQFKSVHLSLVNIGFGLSFIGFRGRRVVYAILQLSIAPSFTQLLEFPIEYSKYNFLNVKASRLFLWLHYNNISHFPYSWVSGWFHWGIHGLAYHLSMHHNPIWFNSCAFFLCMFTRFLNVGGVVQSSPI